MNYIVFDLEATCQQGSPKNFINETIEIGAVKIARSGIDFFDQSLFDRFIKPKVNPVLSDFCKNLTHIRQSDVDNADYFPAVVEDFTQWIGYADYEPYVLCSWGFYDKKQLQKDCVLHGLLDSKWTENHISLKHQFAEIMNIKPCGMDAALRLTGMSLDGLHHRGIDDAKNILKIFLKFFDYWKFPLDK